MDLEKRIKAFTELGAILRNKSNLPDTAIDKASKKNGWFTEENIRLAIVALGEMLREDKLRAWVDKYPQVSSPKSQVPSPKSTAKSVGVIMAGNIPLVGFHDFLCVLMSGNTFIGKLSSDDPYLLPAVAKVLTDIETGFEKHIDFTEQPLGKSKSISAFIATGSNNSARYFEYYFGKHPHIIRKNRNAVAILDGKETQGDLQQLGKDIFQYFGMGCRNVSKIYVPQDYNLDKFFSGIVDFGDVINHNKYYNNHQYHRTIYLLNNEKFLDNNFLMLKESTQIASPVATLYYERYGNEKELLETLENHKENIQCVVASKSQVSSLKSQVPSSISLPLVESGKSQSPELWNYADGIDTMEFLLSL